MASTDSSLAVSMNAQVLTTITSALAASGVTSWPASRAMPSMTSPSTRFLGQPRERKPIFMKCFSSSSGIQPVQHPRRGNRLPQVPEPTYPRRGPSDAQANPAVRDAAEAAQIEIPLERFARELVLVDP